ncbi:hypothetical protein GCM10007978_16990 [Shewanella hanedai]|uniref:2TM domain-containing protein n=1 Tax=Shewanella hanedai TaxID=25 RepID=A0A553JSK2_SHEHA|nr:hypothetical protein [Shewanella hanedai]TRY15437.1 hypothetical protein FN961_05080 [Shewanella hanedai]GGI79772.1 hypothetical protein GCM10007978_16990 [Shewanella hanedai]
MDTNKTKDKQYLFDNPKNIKRVLYTLYASCFLLVVLDFVIHRHVYHSWENLPLFYPLYGFVGCVVLVFVAKWMRTFLMRPEDYYDNPKDDYDIPDDVDSEHTLKNAADENTHKGQTDQTTNTIGGHDVDA